VANRDILRVSIYLGHLLDYSCGPEYDQIMDYAELIRQFTELNEQAVNKGAEGPFEWSSVANRGNSSEVAHWQREEDENGGEVEDGNDDEDEQFRNSYFSWDIDLWGKSVMYDNSRSTLSSPQPPVPLSSGLGRAPQRAFHMSADVFEAVAS
jgi:hypothetical protein